MFSTNFKSVDCVIAADHQREQAGPRAAESTDRVAQRLEPEGQGDRHEEQASDEVSVIHSVSVEVVDAVAASSAWIERVAARRHNAEPV